MLGTQRLPVIIWLRFALIPYCFTVGLLLLANFETGLGTSDAGVFHAAIIFSAIVVLFFSLVVPAKNHPVRAARINRWTFAGLLIAMMVLTAGMQHFSTNRELPFQLPTAGTSAVDVTESR